MGERMMAAGGGVVLMLALTAAAPVPSGGDRVVRSFTACRAIAESAERLACFDKAASALETAVSSKEVTILDKTDVAKTRRSLFGFSLPSLALFNGGGKDAQEDERKAFTEINTTVASARQSSYGRYEIKLADEDGAVWQTTEPLPDVPKAGQKIRIRKGAMGSYFLTVDGRSVRGMRIR